MTDPKARRRVCACGCGELVPKGRKKYAAEPCARRADRATAKAKKPPRPTTTPGIQRNGRVFLPGHPLARRDGWVLVHRLEAFDERGGIAVCDASGMPLDWPAARVVSTGSGRMVLCMAHTRIRSFGQWLTDSGFGGPAGADIAARLAVLWSTVCPVESPPSGGDRATKPTHTTSGVCGLSGSDPTIQHGEVRDVVVD